MKKTYIKNFLQAIVFSLTLNYCHAQSDIAAIGGGHAGGASTTYYCGWNGATTFDFDLRHNGPYNMKFFTDSIERMIIKPGIGTGGGYVGIGNNFLLPASRLHVRQGSSVDAWFQITGNNMSDLSTDGLRIGVLNPAGGPYDVQFRQQENAPVKFYTTLLPLPYIAI